MAPTTSFYQTPGTYTNPREFRQLLQALPDDNKEIVKFIKMVLIHLVDARNSGVRFNYHKAWRSQVDHRSIDDVLASSKVHTLLSLNILDLRTEPAQRGIFSCDHHAVLFASILRLKGRAVRARCGYATYIIPGKLVPHWVCEVYNDHRRRWEYIDPERVKFKFAQGDFLPGGQVWLDVRQGNLEFDGVLPDYRSGLDGIKYRLLNDINALMKNELLNYDWLLRKLKRPQLFSKRVSQLREEECILLELLATFSLDVDAHWDQIRELYTDYVGPENLRVPV